MGCCDERERARAGDAEARVVFTRFGDDLRECFLFSLLALESEEDETGMC